MRRASALVALVVAGLLLAGCDEPPPPPDPTGSSSSSSPTTTESPTATPGSRDRGDWPDASSTGVPAGTELAAYTGPLLIRTDNVTIDGKTVTGDIRVSAKNFTLRNSKVNGSVVTVDGYDTTGATITDSEVDPGARQIHAVRGNNWTITRANLHGGQGAAMLSASTITDSYLHVGPQPEDPGNWHTNGLLAYRDVTARHNYIVCDSQKTANGQGNCTASLSCLPDYTPCANLTFEDNWIAPTPAGYFTVYGGSTKGKAYSGDAENVRFIGNVWERSNQTPVRDFDPSRPGAVWRDNVWSDDGSPVTY